MFLFGLLWLLGVTKRLSLGFSHALMSFVCLVVGDIAFLLLTFFDVLFCTVCFDGLNLSTCLIYIFPLSFLTLIFFISLENSYFCLQES